MSRGLGPTAFLNNSFYDEDEQQPPPPAPADPHPRGRETSGPLTEARTVLSRAENALETLERFRGWRDRGDADAFTTEYYTKAINDPDLDAMISALMLVRDALDRWRRTGRPRKGAAK